MNNYCKICDKQYSSYKSLWQHNNKYHISDTIIEQPKKKKLNRIRPVCEFCGRSYANHSNLNRHLTKCQMKPIDTKLNDNKSIQLSNILSQDKSTIESLIKVLSESISKDSMSHSHNVNNQQMNNSQNTTINNTVVVSLGNENVPHQLTEREQLNILKQKNKALEELIKLVHFSNKYPQFHNIAINEDVAYKYDDDIKGFIEIDKEELITKVIQKRVDDISDINWSNKSKIHKDIYENINKYISGLGNTSKQIEAEEEVEDVVCKGTEYLLNAKKIKLIKKSIH